MPPVTPSRPKSERTRQRILDAAVALFEERGFQATTLREIAARAEVSLGLTYRYFARKEDLAFALYERMSEAHDATVAALPPAPLAARFATLMHTTVDRLDEHRGAFLAIAARSFDPTDDLGVLGSNTATIRDAARAAWGRVVDGAVDVPADLEPDQRAALVDAIYTLNLLLVLIWTQDRAAGRPATRGAIDAATGGLLLAAPLLATPFGAMALAQISAIAGQLGIGAGVSAPGGGAPPG